LIRNSFLHLKILIQEALSYCDAVSNKTMIFECNHTEDGQFSLFVGAKAAREVLLGEFGKEPPHPAILLVGILPLSKDSTFDCPSRDYNFRSLMKWSGAAYLQYGFSKVELNAAIARITEGANKPLPRELLPEPNDLLQLNSDIRHWLENRKGNTLDTLSDFRNTLSGEMLHPSHLEPVAAITMQHRELMLDRFFAFDVYVQKMTNSSDEFNAVKNAIVRFEAHWQSLEVARKTYRSELSKGSSCNEIVRIVINKLELACNELEIAIQATRLLDNSLKMVAKGHK